MGKRQGRGRGRGGGGGRGNDKRQKTGGGGTGWDTRSSWAPPEKSSPYMESYYQTQMIVADEEWSEFMAACRAPLPTTFRISPTCTFANEIRTKFKARHEEFKNVLNQIDEDDGERLCPPQPMKWYPDDLAWFMTISKKALKRTPGLEKFHQYLVAETESGNITRQEFIHYKCGSGGVPPGIVLANDADQDRCKMLIHQMKRINSPSLLVLNHEAEKLPMLWMRNTEPNPSVTGGGKERPIPFRFDRVLADVPCSGDGTMRKNVDVWRKWSPGQIRILSRGVELAQDGGLIVYSTCSMNPIENEAVVAQVLRTFAGTLELVDVSHELPFLKRSPGLLTWKVRDRRDETVWWDTFAEVPQNSRQVCPESMFPPRDAAKLHLQRCVRVYPHQQDTGAFFICKLRKLPKQDVSKSDEKVSEDMSAIAGRGDSATDMDVQVTKAPSGASGDGGASGGGDECPGSELKAATSADSKPDEQASEAPCPEAEAAASIVIKDEPGPEASNMGESNASQEHGSVDREKGSHGKGAAGGGRNRHKDKDEVLIAVKDTALVQRIVDFFGLGEDFPREQLLTSSDTTNKIYFVSKAVHDILKADVKGQLKIVHAGVKMFEKNPTKGDVFDYRLRQEGVPFMLPSMSKRKVLLNRPDFSKLLADGRILMHDLTTEAARKELQAMEGGCVLLILDDASGVYTGSKTVYMAGWRGAYQVTLFVSKFEVEALKSKFAPEQPDQAPEQPPEAAPQPGAPPAQATSASTSTGSGSAAGGTSDSCVAGQAAPSESEAPQPGPAAPSESQGLSSEAMEQRGGV